MRKLFKILGMLGLCLTSVAMKPLLLQDQKQTPRTKTVKTFRKQFKSSIKEELGYFCNGMSSEDEDGKIVKLRAKFTARRSATLEEARALVVYLSERLATEASQCAPMKEYLSVHPFPMDKCEITLSFRSEKGYRYPDGRITYVYHLVNDTQSPRNVIYYCAQAPTTMGEDFYECHETFAEAVERAKEDDLSYPFPHAFSQKEKVCEKLVDDIADLMFKTFKLETDFIGGDMRDKVEDLRVSFWIGERREIDKAKHELIEVTNALLDKVNSNQALRPYLAIYPFTADRLWIRIQYGEKRGMPFYDGSVDTLSLKKGNVEIRHPAYTIFDKPPEHDTDNDWTELTYNELVKEALKKT